MKIRWINLAWTLALFGFVLFFAMPVSADETAGKKIFLDNKCNTCHSIESQEIKKTLATSKAPDLSNVGAERKGDWIIEFLQKKVDLNGKKHMKAWTGKEEDLKTLAVWLETLKKK